MMYSSDVEVTAGVLVGDDYSIDYHLCGDEVEFDCGGKRGLNLLVSEGGLETLVTKATEALHALRAEAADPVSDDEQEPA